MTERDDHSAKPGPKKPLTPAAERALAEAAERRAKNEARNEAKNEAKNEANRQAQEKPQDTSAPKEVGGPSGPEPTRYGDWEKKGLTSDF